MQIIHELDKFVVPWESCILTLGVFDGVHLGHQAILKKLQEQSYKSNYSRVLLTYHPHPDLVLGKRKALGRTELFTYKEKLFLLRKFNLDAIGFLSFTPQVARLSARQYLEEVILNKLQAKHIIIGHDQHFGYAREGNYQFLKKMSSRYSFQVEQIPAVKYYDEIVSSTAIRNYILEGNLRKASSLLGYKFFIQAKVKRGKRMGTKIGFPTINLDVPPEKILPKAGVYTGLVHCPEGSYRAMVNIGTKPTFSSQSEICVEAHLLDFEQNLYDKYLQVSFDRRLRDEVKFESEEALKEQLHKDRRSTMDDILPPC